MFKILATCRTNDGKYNALALVKLPVTYFPFCLKHQVSALSMSFTNKENIMEKKYALQLIYKFSATTIKIQKSSWKPAILYIFVHINK